MTDLSEIDLSTWRGLYELALEVKKMAPWQWMEETDVFGVEDPVGGEIGFVSVMGILGEHFAIALYLDPDAIYRMWHLSRKIPSIDAAEITQVRHLQLAFEDRSMMDERDRRIIRALGLRFRGENAWPHFRSYRVGYHPWHLEPDEISRFAMALEHLLEVAPRFRENPGLLSFPQKDRYLVRSPEGKKGGGLGWKEMILAVPEPPVRPVSPVLPENMGALQRLPGKKNALEIDFSAFGVRIGKEGERPRLPYVFLAVESASGLLLDVEMMEVIEGVEAALARLPSKIGEVMLKQGFRPAEIRVRNESLHTALDSFCRGLKIKLKEVARLPALSKARDALDSFMQRR